ncbi:MAG: helix-turn-helix transcriptional regulator [Aerococcus sp.]|nr:helix-turn-helix transcriptional regulator [Aerococcus sp.]
MFIERIKEKMDEKGYCQASLARKVGLTPAGLSHLLKGETKTMRLSTAFKLADVLGIDVNELRRNES